MGNARYHALNLSNAESALLAIGDCGVVCTDRPMPGFKALVSVGLATVDDVQPFGRSVYRLTIAGKQHYSTVNLKRLRNDAALAYVAPNGRVYARQRYGA